MTKNIYIVTGDSYLVHEYMIKQRDNFIEKYGMHNVLRDIQPQDMQSLLQSQWLFNEKYLIICDNIFWKISEETKQERESIIPHLSQSPHIFIICSPKPDTRTTLYKSIAKISDIKDLSKVALKKAQLISTYLPGSTYTFDWNDDLWLLESELQKISSYPWPISQDIIDWLSYTPPQKQAFDRAVSTLKSWVLPRAISKEELFPLLWWLGRLVRWIIMRKSDTYKKHSHPPLTWGFWWEIYQYITICKNLLDLEYDIKSWNLDSDIARVRLSQIVKK